ncbi:uncharacterized protein LOC115089536 [Rhinatrema bivittatum]|uniref:uncharacterized protein LOC115089536 n=1 Tax=Rhinatrema bivittatum TaxID=194408 RepID=UPI001129CB22|nr:uncharacterized protein LOC115089536 [Rhinatrema bivittatum]
MLCARPEMNPEQKVEVVSEREPESGTTTSQAEEPLKDLGVLAGKDEYKSDTASDDLSSQVEPSKIQEETTGSENYMTELESEALRQLEPVENLKEMSGIGDNMNEPELESLLQLEASNCLKMFGTGDGMNEPELEALPQVEPVESLMEMTEIGNDLTNPEPEMLPPQVEASNSLKEMTGMGDDMTKPKPKDLSPQVEISKSQKEMAGSRDHMNELLILVHHQAQKETSSEDLLNTSADTFTNSLRDLVGEKLNGESYEERTSDQSKNRRQIILREMNNTSDETTGSKLMEEENIANVNDMMKKDKTGGTLQVGLSDLTSDNQLHRTSIQSNLQLNLPVNKLRNLKLLNLKLKHKNHHDDIHNQSLADLTDFATDTDENDPSHQTEDNKRNDTHGKELGIEPAQNSSLIELLSLCHLKLEQLEDLKHSSKELATKLWETKETVVYLKQKVSELEMENSQKEQASRLLSEELTESKSLLCEKNKEIAHMKMLIRNLNNQLQKKHNDLFLNKKSHEKKGQLDKDSEMSLKKDHPSNSKICVLL